MLRSCFQLTLSSKRQYVHQFEKWGFRKNGKYTDGLEALSTGVPYSAAADLHAEAKVLVDEKANVNTNIGELEVGTRFEISQDLEIEAQENAATMSFSKGEITPWTSESKHPSENTSGAVMAKKMDEVVILEDADFLEIPRRKAQAMKEKYDGLFRNAGSYEEIAQIYSGQRLLKENANDDESMDHDLIAHDRLRKMTVLEICAVADFLHAVRCYCNAFGLYASILQRSPTPDWDAEALSSRDCAIFGCARSWSTELQRQTAKVIMHRKYGDATAGARKRICELFLAEIYQMEPDVHHRREVGSEEARRYWRGKDTSSLFRSKIIYDLEGLGGYQRLQPEIRKCLRWCCSRLSYSYHYENDIIRKPESFDKLNADLEILAYLYLWCDVDEFTWVPRRQANKVASTEVCASTSGRQWQYNEMLVATCHMIAKRLQSGSNRISCKNALICAGKLLDWDDMHLVEAFIVAFNEVQIWRIEQRSRWTRKPVTSTMTRYLFEFLGGHSENAVELCKPCDIESSLDNIIILSEQRLEELYFSPSATYYKRTAASEDLSMDLHSSKVSHISFQSTLSGRLFRGYHEHVEETVKTFINDTDTARDTHDKATSGCEPSIQDLSPSSGCASDTDESDDIDNSYWRNYSQSTPSRSRTDRFRSDT